MCSRPEKEKILVTDLSYIYGAFPISQRMSGKDAKKCAVGSKLTLKVLVDQGRSLRLPSVKAWVVNALGLRGYEVLSQLNSGVITRKQPETIWKKNGRGYLLIKLKQSSRKLAVAWIQSCWQTLVLINISRKAYRRNNFYEVSCSDLLSLAFDNCGLGFKSLNPVLFLEALVTDIPLSFSIDWCWGKVCRQLTFFPI